MINSFVYLKNDKRLNLSAPKESISSDVCESLEGYKVFSFRKIKGVKPSSVYKIYPHTDLRHEVSDKIALINIETDSPSATVIFWRLLHALPVGGEVAIDFSSTIINNIFTLEYYKNSFVLTGKTVGGKVLFYKKTQPLIVENDRGLSGWTFGIPVGPGDATFLNAIVSRILELKIENSEIILCGRPGENFKFFDHVKIVGEDIPVPPVRISRKKNEIVNHANYNNICILHDRVMLPINFVEAMESYGDDYPVLTMPSLHFRDKFNLIPLRYSDYNFLENTEELRHTRSGLSPERRKFINKDVLSEYDGNIEFNYKNPLRYSRGAYNTGSLYIVKKNLFQKFPLDENLHWAEFEDVEFGLRLSTYGVPTLVNPYAITQSIFMRSLLQSFYSVSVEKINGKIGVYKPLTSILSGLVRMKPLLKMKRVDYEKRLKFFCDKYIPEETKHFVEQINSHNNKRDLIEKFFLLVDLSEFPKDHDSTSQYIDDLEKYVFCEQVPYSFKQKFINAIHHGLKDKSDFIVMSPMVMNRFVYSKDDGLCEEYLDFFLKKSLLLRLGTFLSALMLYMRRRNTGIYLDGGVIKYYRSILGSTPLLKKGS
ncbi:MAG: hypothetical protein JJ964_00605 [Rhizobiales bacterium]|nr:hypothetical protein [Hyphomicrobiales bacterium]